MKNKKKLSFISSCISYFLHFFHRLSTSDISFIRHLSYFSDLSDTEWKQLKKHTRYITYKKQEILFSEADRFDGLYIIVKGSIRITKKDMHNQSIILAILKPGGYFGEQAFMRLKNKTQNVSVESLEDGACIEIKSTFLNSLKAMQEDTDLKKKLARIGYSQAILPFTIKILRSFKELLYNAQNIKKYRKNDVIFNIGDEANNVYLILQGEVELIIPTPSSLNERTIILYQGSLIGEISALHQLKRGATAIVRCPSSIFVIDNKKFKEIYANNLSLQKLSRELTQTYQLYQYKRIDQYPSNSTASDASITNIVHLHNGKKIISIRSFNYDTFCMLIAEGICQHEYKFINENQNYVKLFVTHHRLLKVETYGTWKYLPHACCMIMDGTLVSEQTIQRFLSLGELPDEVLQEEYLCTCMSVTKYALLSLISQGVKSMKDLSIQTGAGTVCGGCQYKILELLNNEVWEEAEMELATSYHEHAASFYLRPFQHRKFIFLPGQSVTIKILVQGREITRTYSISSAPEDTLPIRLTIKRKQNGTFSQWLFTEAPEKFKVNMTIPQGYFVINPDPLIPAVCFAGGMGVTPFIAYMRFLCLNQISKPLFLIYSAHTYTDFIFLDEIKELQLKNPYIQVEYRNTSKQGHLTSEEIIYFSHIYKEPDVYICAPDAFESFIYNTLVNEGFNPKNIFMETFKM
ncbi:cyclic nucleotide-binding domain-containing protein (plasmid) [Legionella sp. D16C41]|uniref:cyclic nucleotide-binding domain-containing protein n=1 Tax=Legionella sp. D16C41 TaxID=3402688 RepID=UPI003AF9BF25